MDNHQRNAPPPLGMREGYLQQMQAHVDEGGKLSHKNGVELLAEVTRLRDQEAAVVRDYRRERIERLLHELRYEVERGMMEREIDEEINFRFIVPFSKKIPDGMVFCEFRTRPVTRYDVLGYDVVSEPKLRLVK